MKKFEKSRDELVAEYSSLHDYSIALGGFCGLLASLLVAAVGFVVVWSVYPQQVEHYSDFVTASIKDEVHGLTNGFIRKRAKQAVPEPELRELSVKSSQGKRATVHVLIYRRSQSLVVFSHGAAFYLAVPGGFVIVCLLFGLGLGVARRNRRHEEMLIGKRIAGTVIATPSVYNEKNRGDGMVYVVKARARYSD